MRVSEAMTRDVRLAKPEQSIMEAARMMAGIDAGALPVATEERLVGMTTDRDITVRAVARGRAPGQTRASDVMTPDVKYCFEDEEIDDVVRNVAGIKVRRLPVVNREKRLVGIIALGDVANRGEEDHAAEALEGVSVPGGPNSQTPR